MLSSSSINKVAIVPSRFEYTYKAVVFCLRYGDVARILLSRTQASSMLATHVSMGRRMKGRCRRPWRDIKENIRNLLCNKRTRLSARLPACVYRVVWPDTALIIHQTTHLRRRASKYALSTVTCSLVGAAMILSGSKTSECVYLCVDMLKQQAAEGERSRCRIVHPGNLTLSFCLDEQERALPSDLIGIRQGSR